jgi:protein-disulfide isomerase
MTDTKRRSHPPQPASVTPRQPARRQALILAAIAAPIIIAVVLATALFRDDGGAGGLAIASTTPSPGAASTAPAAVPLIHPDSPTRGPADAAVTLVEFIDPECESCRAAYPLVEQLLTEYDGQLRLVLRYVPGHRNSALATAALEEAGRQGRYWEMLERLFERQPDWGEQATPQTEAFLAYGAEIGLDVARLATALEDPDLSKVERDAADAAAMGIRGTPTFFVNGSELVDLSEAGLRAMIEAALPR